MKTKVKFVVVDECILGYIHEQLPGTVQILKSSVLKGATGTTNLNSSLALNEGSTRQATKKDFKEFNVDVSQYENDSIYDYVICD